MNQSSLNHGQSNGGQLTVLINASSSMEAHGLLGISADLLPHIILQGIFPRSRLASGDGSWQP